MGQKDISIGSGRDIEDGQQDNVLYIRPAVDIFETEQGLTLVADLPGVDKEDLHIDLDQGLLTVQAKAGSNLHGEQIRREFQPGNYYRQFKLPDEIDAEKIAAELKDGVLNLQLPKAEAARPRRIEITTG